MGKHLVTRSEVSSIQNANCCPIGSTSTSCLKQQIQNKERERWSNNSASKDILEEVIDSVRVTPSGMEAIT